MADYCLYCWREAETTMRGNPDEDPVPCCAYHFLSIGAADVSKDTFAQEMGYESSEEVIEQYENEEEPQLGASEVIGLINHHTDPGDPQDEPVVESHLLNRKISEKVNSLNENKTEDSEVDQ